MSREHRGLPGERQVKVRGSLKGSGEGQVMVWWSGEVQVKIRRMSNFNLSLTFVDVKLVRSIITLDSVREPNAGPRPRLSNH